MAADQENPKRLQPHPLIAKLMSQASSDEPDAELAPSSEQLPNVQVLTGYLARDPQPGMWRIYEDLNLNTYFTVAESDIVGSQQTATEQEPLLPTIVWVKQGAVLQYTSIQSGQVQAASFLQGDMLSNFMRGGIGSQRESRLAGMRVRGRNVMGAAVNASADDMCPSVDWCRSRDYGGCFTRIAACFSENVCASDRCVSGGQGCF